METNSTRDLYLLDSHKIQYHTDRVEQWKKDPLNTFPIYIEVSPVGHCNHRCTFCAVDYIGYKIRKLDTDRLKHNIFSMSVKGVRSIMFAGEGEPLLHPDLPEIIKYTHKHGIDVSITTNGIALTEKFMDKCLKHIKWIKVSVNGGKESYAPIHQTRQEDWDKVWTNLRRVSEYKDECGLDTVIGVQSVLLPENEKDIVDVMSLGRAYHLDYMVIKPYSQHHKSITRKYEGLNYEGSKVLDHLRGKAIEYSTGNFKVVVRERSIENYAQADRGYCKCYSTPYFWAYIMATGDVYGCSAYLEDDRFKYGNINEELFADIWTGAGRQRSMEYVANELDISECRKNCRMDKVNRYLWDIKNPNPHKNFI